jgi:large subunit ribosomal protein L9
MKVVFLQDVERVARAGEIKDVADGYGRNYLIPQKLAVPANARSMAAVETQIKARAKLVAKTESEVIELASQLDGKEVTLKAKSGVNDRLYGSITAADVAAEIESALGMVIDRKKVEIDSPIRQLGSYEVTVRLSHDIAPKVTLTVASEDGRVVEKASAAKKETVAEKTEVTEEAPAAEEAEAAEQTDAPAETEDTEEA